MHPRFQRQIFEQLSLELTSLLDPPMNCIGITDFQGKIPKSLPVPSFCIGESLVEIREGAITLIAVSQCCRQNPEPLARSRLDEGIDDEVISQSAESAAASTEDIPQAFHIGIRWRDSQRDISLPEQVGNLAKMKQFLLHQGDHRTDEQIVLGETCQQTKTCAGRLVLAPGVIPQYFIEILEGQLCPSGGSL